LGLMGHGIAQSAAQSGFNVIAYEEEDRFLESGRSRIEGSLGKMLKREKITKDKYDEIMSRITYTTKVEDLSTSDLVVEAVIENMDLKKKVGGRGKREGAA
jgi:3-hydroxyacyl-CoA dehydrogenase